MSRPNCRRWTCWAYEIAEHGTLWSWACSCGLDLGTSGTDPLTVRSSDDCVRDSQRAHREA